jgi:2-haloacid dehalogenase
MRYRLLTFDVYSALYDIEGSLTPRVAEALPQSGGLSLVRTWRRKQLEYALISNSLGQGRVSFRLITRRALDYALAQARLDPPNSARESLVEAWDELRLWPEAAEALSAVKARGYVIGLLSNGDEAMLRALARQLPITVDHIFASEHAGWYKPHPSVYALPRDVLKLKPAEILHVAGSPTDVMGAKAAGLPCAWSNRHGERVLDPHWQADYEFGNLRGVLEAA